MERAAGGLKQRGPRILGFQNSGLSNGAIHPRSTTHPKPFLPSTAGSLPRGPSTRTPASWDRESGAALRAMAISAFRSFIRYWLSGAMLGYGFSDCACICEIAPSAITRTELPNAVTFRIFRSIHPPFGAEVV